MVGHVEGARRPIRPPRQTSLRDHRVTRSIQRVAPPIATRLKRGPNDLPEATQEAASPDRQLRNDLISLAHLMKDGGTEGRRMNAKTESAQLIHGSGWIPVMLHERSPPERPYARSSAGSLDLLDANESHGRRCRSFMQVGGVSRSHAVNDGRAGCCTSHLYTHPAVDA